MDMMGLFETLFLGYMIRVQKPFLLNIYWSVTIVFFIIVFLIADKQEKIQSLFLKLLFFGILILNIFLTITFSQKVKVQMDDFEGLVKEIENYNQVNNEYPSEISAMPQKFNIPEKNFLEYKSINGMQVEIKYKPFGFRWHHLEYYSWRKEIIVND
jgi:uncharacterized membrane protein YbjE (DUF340 family)